MADIRHVVVLMLENRSFDSMLGGLYPGDVSYRGLTLQEFNNYNNTPYGVWNDTGMLPHTAVIPDPDPGESFADITYQLFGKGGRPQAPAPATMIGFACNYVNQALTTKGVFAPSAVMHYFSPQQVPVISSLAQTFGVCDQWHASAPCQTWPNRFFTHTGTCLGYANNSDFHIPFEAPSVFDQLQNAGASWRVYFHDMPQSILLKDVWLHALSSYRDYSQFLADAQTGNLCNYSFIEPRYFADLFEITSPNDEHPPHNVIYGEKLIADVYNALRSSRCWPNTLLIITYDEHGGCFDHVSPPKAVSPDNCTDKASGFAFDTYGVRVPAVIVSPWIPPGTKVRNPVGPDGVETPFDHTSIIKTVHELFLPANSAFLTRRDAAAPSVLGALTLPGPTNLGPPSIGTVVAKPTLDQISTLAGRIPNSVQAVLAAATHLLPESAPSVSSSLPTQSAPVPLANYSTVARAAATAISRVNSFLGRRQDS